MKYVELHARQKGHFSVKVLSSVTAYSFYQQLGYQTTDLRDSEKYGNVIVMEKQMIHA
jgi:hypothetical protein